MKSDDDNRRVTVCAACKRASCWQGTFLCDDARAAGTKEMTVAELRVLGREAPGYWEKAT